MHVCMHVYMYGFFRQGLTVLELVTETRVVFKSTEACLALLVAKCWD